MFRRVRVTCRGMLAAAGAAALGLTLAACGGGGSSNAPVSIAGAGATFPAPIYTRWAEDYKAGGGGELNYQAIGSGAGINQIKASTVDFGASDKPLKPADLQAAGLYQFPTVVGGVTPIVNIPNMAPGQLKLTGAVLADIYLGKIKSWDDKAIAAVNAGLKLPKLPIAAVHRAEGSGTSFLFTSYLAIANPAWGAGPGASDSPSWPVGVGGKGNDGVAGTVKTQTGAIGYVEYAYAKQNNLTTVQLQNKDGQFVDPVADNFAAAAAGADWSKAEGNYLLLLDQPGAKSWPITGATFILLHTKVSDAKLTGAVLKFFDWAYASGDADATALDYVPLPQTVKDMVRQQWAATLKDDSGKPIFTPAAPK